MIKTEERTLGASGITASALGARIWNWGDKSIWGYGQSLVREEVIQAYRASVNAGITFFDTAELHGLGESEQLLGACQRADGRPIVIASKFAPLPTRLSAYTLLEALDRSLERLGVESIDLYQIHWPTPLLKIDTLMDALAHAVRAGKVRAVGVSNYTAQMMRQAQKRLARYNIPLASNQVHYSLLHRNPETDGVLDACRKFNVALIAYSPLEQGILTGKFRTGAVSMPLSNRVITAPYLLQRQKYEPLFTELEDIASERGKTLGQVALNWLLCKDECIIPIPVAKNVRQATENAGALGWRLTDEEHTRISRSIAQ